MQRTLLSPTYSIVGESEVPKSIKFRLSLDKGFTVDSAVKSNEFPNELRITDVGQVLEEKETHAMLTFEWNRLLLSNVLNLYGTVFAKYGTNMPASLTNIFCIV